jgi:hypothetical protein
MKSHFSAHTRGAGMSERKSMIDMGMKQLSLTEFNSPATQRERASERVSEESFCLSLLHDSSHTEMSARVKLNFQWPGGNKKAANCHMKYVEKRAKSESSTSRLYCACR